MSVSYEKHFEIKVFYWDTDEYQHVCYLHLSVEERGNETLLYLHFSLL